jgi:hypothetical protein
MSQQESTAGVSEIQWILGREKVMKPLEIGFNREISNHRIPKSKVHQKLEQQNP